MAISSPSWVLAATMTGLSPMSADRRLKAAASWGRGAPDSFRFTRPSTRAPSAWNCAADASSWGRMRSKADRMRRAMPGNRAQPLAVFSVIRALIRASFTPRRRAVTIRLGQSSLSTKTPSAGRQWSRKAATAAGPSTGAN